MIFKYQDSVRVTRNPGDTYLQLTIPVSGLYGAQLATLTVTEDDLKTITEGLSEYLKPRIGSDVYFYDGYLRKGKVVRHLPEGEVEPEALVVRETSGNESRKLTITQWFTTVKEAKTHIFKNFDV